MKSHTNLLDSGLRTMVLICILVIIYAGPASAIGLEHIFDDDFFESTSGTDLMPWIGFVWLFSVPLVLAYRWWDTNPAGSTTALGVYVTVMLLLWMISRSLGALVLGLALAAPSYLLTDADPDVDSFYYSAAVLSLFVCILIPISGIAFQISRREDWAKLRY